MKHLTDSWIYEDSKRRAIRVAEQLRDSAEREAMRLPKRLAALKFYASRFTHNLRGGR
jgi:hypothetical protein